MGYVEDIYRVCLRSIRMDVTYRLEDGSYIYIYLISTFYNAVDIAYDYVSLTDVYFTYSIYSEYFKGYVRFWFAAYVSLQIEIPGGPLWTT